MKCIDCYFYAGNMKDDNLELMFSICEYWEEENVLRVLADDGEAFICPNENNNTSS